MVAKLKKKEHLPGRSWAWALWEAELPLPQGHGGKVKLICKAVDANCNVQPDTANGVCVCVCVCVCVQGKKKENP